MSEFKRIEDAINGTLRAVDGLRIKNRADRAEAAKAYEDAIRIYDRAAQDCQSKRAETEKAYGEALRTFDQVERNCITQRAELEAQLAQLEEAKRQDSEGEEWKGAGG